MWEAVFMLLVLKVPLVYLGVVVWWAIRAEPRPEEPAALVPAISDTPPDGTRRRPRLPHGRPSRAPHRSGPSRRPARVRLASAAVGAQRRT